MPGNIETREREMGKMKFLVLTSLLPKWWVEVGCKGGGYTGGASCCPLSWSILYPCLTTDETGVLSWHSVQPKPQGLATVPSAFPSDE